MKKIFVALFAALGLLAGNAAEPNRMIVFPTAGSVKAYATDRIQEIKFGTVEGPVRADLTLLQMGGEGDAELTVSVYKTQACKSFKLDILPYAQVGRYDDAAFGLFIDQNTQQTYYEDFSNGVISGANLQPGTDYVIATVGIDEYGVLGEVSKVRFTTPSAQIIGNPTVEYTVDKVGLYSFTISFKPNADTRQYACVAYKKGKMEDDFLTYAPMFGFSNIGQMIMQWGEKTMGASTKEWKGMDPNTEYEVYVQPTDINGNFGNLVCVPVKTRVLGGDGEAVVNVTLGDYVLADWNDEMLPSQFVNYEPNDQTWRYHFGVYTKKQVDDLGADVIMSTIMEEPEQEFAYYWFFEEFSTDYQINPNVEFSVFVGAQNANGVWGPGKQYDFKTAASVDGSNKVVVKLVDVKTIPARAPKAAKSGNVAPTAMKLTAL